MYVEQSVTRGQVITSLSLLRFDVSFTHIVISILFSDTTHQYGSLEQYTNSSFILTKCSPTANHTQSMGYLVFTMPPTKQASVRSFSLRRPTTGKVGMWRRKIRWKGAYAQKMRET